MNPSSGLAATFRTKRYLCVSVAPSSSGTSFVPVCSSIDQGLSAKQGGEIPGLRADAGQAVRGEPVTYVLRVTGEEESAPRVRDHVDDLR